LATSREQTFNFLTFIYFYSQIWQNCLMDGHRSCITKLKKKKEQCSTYTRNSLGSFHCSYNSSVPSHVFRKLSCLLSQIFANDVLKHPPCCFQDPHTSSHIPAWNPTLFNLHFWVKLERLQFLPYNFVEARVLKRISIVGRINEPIAK